MDKFCLVAIMLFAIQHDMVDNSIVDVINAIDRVRGIRLNLLSITSVNS